MQIIRSPKRPEGEVRPKVVDMYTATLREGSFQVTTHLPQSFPIGLGANWDQPFNQPLSQLAGVGGDVGEAALSAFTGQTSSIKWLSGNVWTSGSSIEITIPFVLVAYSDPVEDVMKPFVRMLQMVAPSQGQYGNLVAPGPRLGNPEALRGLQAGVSNLAGFKSSSNEGASIKGSPVTLEIGTFFKFSPCVVESVNADIDTQFDANGYPISLTVSVILKSFWTVTKGDIANYFSKVFKKK